MVDIPWEGIPNWITASTSALTLVAAVFAGIFARRAAHWTRKQAEATDLQVDIARTALGVAEQDALAAQTAIDLQRTEADRSARAREETRLNSLAPIIFARAKPSRIINRAFLEIRSADGWTRVDNPIEVQGHETHIFRTNLILEFENVSENVAQVDIIDHASGETELRSGDALFVSPRSSKELLWSRIVPSSVLHSDEINSPQNWLFNMTFWARDLGMNVRDSYRFNADLRFFDRDGSRLLVSPVPAIVWGENVATPLPGRVYERLDANG